MEELILLTPTLNEVAVHVDGTGTVTYCYVESDRFSREFFAMHGIETIEGNNPIYFHFTEPERAFKFINDITPLYLSESEEMSTEESKFRDKYHFWEGVY